MPPEHPIILVVEDDAEMNELERELLALNGMDSVPAYTGFEAIRLAGEQTFDAILLDVMLPELDGLETARRIRQNGSGSIPIVMLTALDTEDCRKRGIDAGADAYFIKPFDPDEVISTLQLLMRDRAG